MHTNFASTPASARFLAINGSDESEAADVRSTGRGTSSNFFLASVDSVPPLLPTVVHLGADPVVDVVPTPTPHFVVNCASIRKVGPGVESQSSARDELTKALDQLPDDREREPPVSGHVRRFQAQLSPSSSSTARSVSRGGSFVPTPLAPPSAFPPPCASSFTPAFGELRSHHSQEHAMHSDQAAHPALPNAADPTPSPQDIFARLNQLQQRHARGEITSDQFAARKKELVDLFTGTQLFPAKPAVPKQLKEKEEDANGLRQNDGALVPPRSKKPPEYVQSGFAKGAINELHVVLPVPDRCVREQHQPWCRSPLLQPSTT